MYTLSLSGLGVETPVGPICTILESPVRSALSLDSRVSVAPRERGERLSSQAHDFMCAKFSLDMQLLAVQHGPAQVMVVDVTEVSEQQRARARARRARDCSIALLARLLAQNSRRWHIECRRREF